MDKYPENYFEHFIFSLSTTNQELNEAGFTALSNLYIEIEGREAFSKLIQEIEFIEENKDWDEFVQVAEEFGMENMELEDIKKLAACAREVHRNWREING
ncbi:hypothetical protein PCCS19_24650 [Paenibacillus sp. CCS19]|uniref:hypothetical protein n=1 Tax=Paenibacillus sp. CCS19 TaxID=3158387 RepID=UPI00256DDD3C|nr:hypothetical protein [Paenibacillus cellulosilyticus]GMK39411.1 hypothetical protein PCCS19_24650 [Paenibacillus cellulosilyticus]